MSVSDSEATAGGRSRWEAVQPWVAPVTLFLVNLLLVYPLLIPNLTEIGLWDEAAYLHTGRLFAEGSLVGFSQNPLTALFYAATYLPFRNQPFWMIYSDWLGRFLQFGLLWLSLYLVSRELPRPSRPVMVMGLFLVAPMAIDLVRFPSDGLFAALAGFSFWQVLRFYNNGNHRNLAAASVFMALAAFARVDGLVSGVVMAAVGLAIGIQRKSVGRSLLAGILPMALLVGGYIVFYGLRTGDFNQGISGRTYDNFESGQMVVYSGTGQMDLTIEAHTEARRVFGTPEENGYSVFRAIARHPRAYLERLVAVVKSLPRTILYAYGIRLTVPIFLLAARGLLELLRQRKRMLAFILLAWPAHLASGFLITLFREGHLRFPYFVVFAMAGLGLGAVLEALKSRREILGWMVVLAGFSVYAIVDAKAAILYGAYVFAIGLLVCALLERAGLSTPAGRQLPLAILLGAGIIIHGGFPSPEPRRLGQAELEQSVLYLERNYAEGSIIASGTPGVIWAAKMFYLGMTSLDVPIQRPPEGFLQWLRDEGAVAVYFDNGMRTASPRLWELISPLIGHGLEVAFSASGDDFLVLNVTPGP
jgi:hypothetical protein